MPSWWLLRSASSYSVPVAASASPAGSLTSARASAIAQHLHAVVLRGGDGDPDGAPGAVAELAVPRLELAALVEHGQAHHPEPQVDVALLLHLEDPP
jgi:hypothetical protein